MDQARIDRFKSLTEADPTNELGFFSLGRAYLDDGQPKLAVPALQRVIALNAGFSKAYALLGTAQHAAGDDKDAIETLTTGYRIANDRGDLMPRNDMANLLKELGAPIPEVSAQELKPEDAAAGKIRCARCSAASLARSARAFMIDCFASMSQSTEPDSTTTPGSCQGVLPMRTVLLVPLSCVVASIVAFAACSSSPAAPIDQGIDNEEGGTSFGGSTGQGGGAGTSGTAGGGGQAGSTQAPQYPSGPYGHDVGSTVQCLDGLVVHAVAKSHRMQETSYGHLRRRVARADRLHVPAPAGG